MTLPLHGFQDWQNPLHTADLQTDVNSTPINAGGNFQTGVFDMRPYQTANLIVSAVSNVSPKTDWGNVQVQFKWYANAAGSQIVYSDRYAFFPQDAAGAFGTLTGRVMYRTPVFGPYLQIVVDNLGPDQINFTWRIIGNTKPSSQREIINTDINGHSQFDPDLGALNFVNQNVGAGLIFTSVGPIAPGLATMWVRATTSPFSVSLQTPQPQSFHTMDVAAGAALNVVVALPKTAYRLNAQNVGGVLGNVLCVITSGRLGM